MEMSKEQTEDMKAAMKEVLKEYMADHKAIMKQTWKDAQKEWLEEKFMEFGKWSFFSVLAASLGALGYFIFVVMGTHK